jgi:hypothetical protein
MVQHQASHDDVNPSFVRASKTFIAFAETARMVQSSEGTLDHPTERQPCKLLRLFKTPHLRQIELEANCDSVQQTTAIAAIDLNLAQLFTAVGQLA